jgi:hypothetical protein
VQSSQAGEPRYARMSGQSANVSRWFSAEKLPQEIPGVQSFMNYTIVEASEISTLVKKVNGMIELKIGWKCVGGLTAFRPTVSGPVTYLQAMENGAGSEPKTGPSMGMKLVNYEQPRRKWERRKPKSND